MNALTVLDRNFPWCLEWDDNSFCGRLHEDSTWHLDEYWLLEWALFELVASPARDAQLNWKVFRIFSSTLMSLSAHLDSKDGYKIRNLKTEQVYECRERLQLVFEGFFSGNMPAISQCFDLPNPLLQSSG
ncbi:Imm41 family immunity protein [Formivibrio citricus]|uniref:Imm41 family immunity protein n=1 Tax=Formivibrio citricus TaxID=83765 RepID=UPI000B80C9E1|nr:Imm41 family immunity protein [Formivibrio citricus]